MEETLQQHGISWEKCVRIDVDNTSVGLGKRNSIMTRVTEKNPAVFLNGCPCHIVHNIACKAGDVYTAITGFDVEGFCVNKSTKRKQSLKKILYILRYRIRRHDQTCIYPLAKSGQCCFQSIAEVC